MEKKTKYGIIILYFYFETKLRKEAIMQNNKNVKIVFNFAFVFILFALIMGATAKAAEVNPEVELDKRVVFKSGSGKSAVEIGIEAKSDEVLADVRYPYYDFSVSGKITHYNTGKSGQYFVITNSDPDSQY